MLPGEEQSLGANVSYNEKAQFLLRGVGTTLFQYTDCCEPLSLPCCRPVPHCPEFVDGRRQYEIGGEISLFTKMTIIPSP